MTKILNQFKQDLVIKGFSNCTENSYLRNARIYRIFQNTCFQTQQLPYKGLSLQPNQDSKAV